mgnify:FL=1
MVLKASEKKNDESNGAFTTSDGMVAVGSAPVPKKSDIPNGSAEEPKSKKVSNEKMKLYCIVELI